MNAGDTFIIALPDQDIDSHMWMLISDPEQSAFGIIVNFTSYREDKDLACVVEPHEHRYLSRKSCISYGHARREPIPALDKLISDGLMVHHEPLSPELLNRIRKSSSNSRSIEQGIWYELVEQGLAPE